MCSGGYLSIRFKMSSPFFHQSFSVSAMTRPFYQSRLKLARASEHARAVGGMIDDYLISNPIRIKEDVIGNYIHFEMTLLSNPPEMLSPTIGDAIHNLRTSLDLLAGDLVAMNGGNSKGVYFPFAENADELETQINKRKVCRASDEVVDLIRSMKPYKGGNHTLRAVHDLDIQDKHTGIIPAVGYGYCTGGGAAPAFSELTPRIFMSGQSLIRPGVDPTPGVRTLPSKVTFHPGSQFPDADIAKTLHNLTKEFCGYVDAFELLCFGGLIE